MSRKFEPGLEKAWAQHIDLADRYMTLLRLVGTANSLEDVREQYADLIDYAMTVWSEPDKGIDGR